MLKRAFNVLVRRLPLPLQDRVRFVRMQRRLPRARRPVLLSDHLMGVKHSPYPQCFVTCSDKVLVKEWARQRIDPAMIVPTLWHGAVLPPRERRDWPLPFVLKANHGSGMNAFVRSPAHLDWPGIERRAADWLATDWPAWLHENWYNQIERQLLVEPMLTDRSGDLPDYKFWVFSGAVHLIQVDTDRFTAHKRAFYDPAWRRVAMTLHYPDDPRPRPRPRWLEAMVDAAARLGRGFDFARVDFYDLADGPRFGEITFCPGAAMERIAPRAQDAALGRLWRSARSARGVVSA